MDAFGNIVLACFFAKTVPFYEKILIVLETIGLMEENGITPGSFTVGIAGTMSAGKSTLINALLGMPLLPARNQATTASITRITHSKDNKEFVARAAESWGAVQRCSFIPAQRTLLDFWNNNPTQYPCMDVVGRIPFLSDHPLGNVKFCFVDTPGPNSIHAEHGELVKTFFASEKLSLLIYVLNGNQLATNDDKNFLCNLREEINFFKNSNIIFVINKIDNFDPETEDLHHIILNVSQYLEKNGFINPKIICTAARQALAFLAYSSVSRKERSALDGFIESCIDFEYFYKSPFLNIEEKLCQAHESLTNKIYDNKQQYLYAFMRTGIPLLEAFLSNCLHEEI